MVDTGDWGPRPFRDFLLHLISDGGGGVRSDEGWMSDELTQVSISNGNVIHEKLVKVLGVSRMMIYRFIDCDC